jgi:4-oxalocrotonate tautomerase
VTDESTTGYPKVKIGNSLELSPRVPSVSMRSPRLFSGEFMPIIHVDILAGRSSETKQALAEQLTRAVVDTLQVSPETVRVLLQEIEREHWFVGGRSLDDTAAASVTRIE